MSSTSLSALGRSAQAGFHKLIETAPRVGVLSTEYERFLIWSASLGVDSLDYRLRNAELVGEVVADLLAELSECISALNDIYSGTRAPYDIQAAEDM